MKTPICDFIRKYTEKNTVRMHMPGHKGNPLLGFENMDITEIKGADSLYEADGIIAQSESNASSLFGCKTFYSAEGSSLCIRAMLYLVSLYAKEKNKTPLILAGRNAHKTFLSGTALLGLDTEWIMPDFNESYLSVTVEPAKLDHALTNLKNKPAAVYITSPDYLGNTADISGIAEICHKHGVLLLVDNAHGAYMHFLPESQHPIAHNADMCCSSAHKTLPVLTGGAYLHISKKAPQLFENHAKNALALFGSTSPSYLILQSLDMANSYINDGYSKKLSDFVDKLSLLRERLQKNGYVFLGNEPLKLTFNTKKYGYDGNCFADILREKNIECEFSDPDHVVLMLTPETKDSELVFLEKTLLSVNKKEEITTAPPKYSAPKKVLSAREAVLSPFETVSAEDSLGRILAYTAVGCPPAVPIVVSGEIIDENAVECFKYYGIKECCVKR